MDKYGDKEQDIERLGTILKYLENLDPIPYPETVVIPYSHHITSVIIDKVFSDTLDGTFHLTYDADEKKMVRQIIDYLDLIGEDPAMLGATSTIQVFGAGKDYVNTTFEPETAFVRGYNTGKDRVWVNKDRMLRIAWYPQGEDLPGRWVIERSIGITRDYYYAQDVDGNDDPWNLVWIPGSYGEFPSPTVKAGDLNLRFIDIDPSYTEASFIDVEHYNAILQLMKGLLPVDATKDGGIH